MRLAVPAGNDIEKVKIREVADALARFAPLPLQESYDNAGLQVGLTEVEVTGALLCLDVTEAVIDEAAAKGCNLVVSHHPLLFRALRQVSDGDYVQRTVMRAIERGVTILSWHTNLDNAIGGVNHKIAEKIGLRDVRPLVAVNRSGGDGALVGASGVVGTLPEPLSAHDFVLLLKRVFAVPTVLANELLQRPVRRVALCGGAGSFLLGEAVRQGADAFVTGEMHYHEYFGHEQELQIAVIGHYESEQYTSEILQSIIQERCAGVRTLVSTTRTNPINYI